MNTQLLERITYLIELANRTLATTYINDTRYPTKYVKSEIFKEFESSSQSFILNLFGEKHPYFISFKETCNASHPGNVERGRGILNSIKTEIEKGWLTELKTLVSAEIFSDFLEMAKYFLDENYKDASAVMLGSVLEENLRQIAKKNNIEITYTNNNGDIKPKKADTINAAFAKAGIYNLLDQKQVTAWLDLRNKAAHGEYEKYEKSQVELMYQGILSFITRLNN
jgi:hypothetical protein